MYAVGRLGSYISRGVFTFSGPFHPFGGAVDIIVVEQPDGSFKSSPWYVKFGKFQGVLKSKERTVSIAVNGIEANFHMFLDHTGEAYFLREIDVEESKSDGVSFPFSSGDEPLSGNRKSMKSESCSYDNDNSNSVAQVDLGNGKLVGRTSSRRSRIFGRVFRERSTKEDSYQDGAGGTGVMRSESLERAEFAAELLEVKWSTNLTSIRSNNNALRFSSSNDALADKGFKEEIQNDAENLSQAYVHDKDKSIDCQTVPDKTDYCNEQNVSCSHTGLENLECSVEEANVQVSCVSTEQQIVETSLLGEGFMEDKCKVIANVLGTMDDRSVRNFDHADNETVAVSGMSVPDLQSEYKFESCIDKRFDEEVADNENNVVLPGCWISNKENVSDGLQAFVYCKTSESSVITLDCSSQQTHQTLCLPDIENGKAQVHAEPLLRATELVPEATVLKKTEDKELDSEGVLTMSVEMVGVDPVIGLEEMKSHSIHITSTISDLGDDVENARTIKDVLHPSLGSLDDSLNFYGDSDPKRSVPPSATSEDEQFLFSDLDEFKLHEPDCVNKDLHSSICTETEEVNGLCNVNNEPCFNPHNFVQESPSTYLDFSVEKAGIVSNPISISRNHKVAGEKNGWQIESLPTTWPIVAKFDVNNNLPLSHSLDSSCETLKWISIKEDDERPLAHGKSSCEESETSRKLENTLYNPCIGDPSKAVVSRSGSWRLWPFSMKRSISRKDVLLAPADNRGLDAKNAVDGAVASDDDKNVLKPKQVKKMIRAITPTSEQLASLNLKDGINHITFTFSTSMLGKQQVDARIYLWKWNTRIVISDVDGTITRSDVLGQFMPMVGIDWLQTGVAHLFSAIKENGYELLFLSARAISQAYITRQFLVNLKQDGKGLPDGPIVISPDGLFPSLYREVIRRAPHEFKIACLEAIKALFPLDCNPFYAGFGNRDTDEMSYLKVGIPKGKIFTINPKGEVVTNHHVATKSYSSLHDLVHRVFPPMASEQEEFNSWNFWKLPPPLINI
ncbi:hypothetical protein ES332_D05G222500v1 [Gossypium tomentosum]|uniref:LNS2/PITP domain-containing protein n=1 Tax=Gossypium tomentosum TaxID=34277 RepID=A0A5D2KYT1_GOSTO|nr:hypothetical protein ES332_D05G222500v1 [Gossypium tomentosum]TYH71985.1 hypothetical protein ES332_D05G222500v1 [Gossypium tomentosum]